MSAITETLRSTVGRDADVPRKRRESDMRAKYIVAPRHEGNAVCLSGSRSIHHQRETRCRLAPHANHPLLRARTRAPRRAAPATFAAKLMAAEAIAATGTETL